MLYVPRSTLDLTAETPAVFTPTMAELGEIVRELAEYHAVFAPLFKRREQRAWAEVYLRGLLIADVPRKNVEAIALRLFGAEGEAENIVRGLQQFVGVGGWADDPILARHRSLVDETLGEEDGVFIIDASDFPKQGKHSVGVARQWSGSLGKRANCQVGVFLGYASRKGYTLLDRRLYLPENWFAEDHRALWEECLILKGTTFQTKPELAADLVEKAVKESRIRGRWVVCDEDYGKDPGFLDHIAALDHWYLAEVACDTMVLLSRMGRRLALNRAPGCRQRTLRARADRRPRSNSIRPVRRRCGWMAGPRGFQPRGGDVTESWRVARGRWWPTSWPSGR